MTQKDLQASMQATAETLRPAVEHIAELDGTTDSVLFLSAVHDKDENGEPGTHSHATIIGSSPALANLIALTLQRHPKLADVFYDALNQFECEKCGCVSCRIELAVAHSNITNNPLNN